MDRKLVLAVAGSGKTRSIIDKLSLEKKSLIITYTHNNYNNLHERVFEKFGEIPKNISIYTYFTFLYTFCYLPCIYYRVGSRSINYNNEHLTFARKGVTTSNLQYYQDYNGSLLGNRLALLVSRFAHAEVLERIERLYDMIIIDEVQDFAAHDFNLINSFSKCGIKEILYVGDYYQHTYDTSRDGNTQRSLFESGYDAYKNAFNSEFVVDDISLSASYRCTKTVCDYVTKNLGINITSKNNKDSRVRIVDSVDEIKCLMKNDNIPKLFYKSHMDYKCASINWGASKGVDKFQDICVVLNPTTWPMVRSGNFSRINKSTKNKLYVAITRAKGSVYFIEQAQLQEYRL